MTGARMKNAGREHHEPERAEDDGEADVEKVVLVLLLPVPAVDQKAEDRIDGHIEDVADHHPFGEPGGDEPLYPDSRLNPQEGSLEVDDHLVVPLGKENKLQPERGAVDIQEDELDGEGAEEKAEMAARRLLGDQVCAQKKEHRQPVGQDE